MNFDITIWNKQVEIITELVKTPETKAALMAATKRSLEALATSYQSQLVHQHSAIQEKYNKIFPESPLFPVTAFIKTVGEMEPLLESMTPELREEFVRGILHNPHLSEEPFKQAIERLLPHNWSDAGPTFILKNRTMLLKLLERPEQLTFEEKKGLLNQYDTTFELTPKLDQGLQTLWLESLRAKELQRKEVRSRVEGMGAEELEAYRAQLYLEDPQIQDEFLKGLVVNPHLSSEELKKELPDSMIAHRASFRKLIQGKLLTKAEILPLLQITPPPFLAESLTHLQQESQFFQKAGGGQPDGRCGELE